MLASRAGEPLVFSNMVLGVMESSKYNIKLFLIK